MSKYLNYLTVLGILGLIMGVGFSFINHGNLNVLTWSIPIGTMGFVLLALCQAIKMFTGNVNK
jgi:hypothetical protein